MSLSFDMWRFEIFVLVQGFGVGENVGLVYRFGRYQYKVIVEVIGVYFLFSGKLE